MPHTRSLFTIPTFKRWTNMKVVVLAAINLFVRRAYTLSLNTWRTTPRIYTTETDRSADRQSHGRISTSRDQRETVPLLPSTALSSTPRVHSPSAGMRRNRPTNSRSAALNVPLSGLHDWCTKHGGYRNFPSYGARVHVHSGVSVEYAIEERRYNYHIASRTWLVVFES